HLPKFNVQLRDDKHPLYIGVTKEKFPRIFGLRRPELAEGLKAWYGPFLSGADVRRVLRLVRRIFPYRSCVKLPEKACLYSHLKLCPGPCFQPVAEYQKTVRRLRLIFSGKTGLLVGQLTREMKKLADEQKFEKAQKVKSQLLALQGLSQGWRQIPVEKMDLARGVEKVRQLLIRWQGVDLSLINKIEGYDISNLGSQIIVGSLVVFISGEPVRGEYRKFKINLEVASLERRKNLSDQNDAGAIGQVLRRRLNHPEWVYPQLILVDGGKPQVSAAYQALKEKGLVGQIGLVGLAKKEELLVIPRFKKQELVGWKQVRLVSRSEGLRLLQQVRDEAHRFARKYYKRLHQKKTFS
ncbi:UvrB/UvrC motif-containing protein, partial [Patescibacteria group bacterium]|nr:UvrB/UvrC motif-containing protein [Patescibacteria group bacterium]